MPKAFPMEFRRDVVAVARKGDASLMQIAKDFGISESCLHRWMRLADIDEGVRQAPPAWSRWRRVSSNGVTGCSSRRTRSSEELPRSSRGRPSQNEVPAGP